MKLQKSASNHKTEHGRLATTVRSLVAAALTSEKHRGCHSGGELVEATGEKLLVGSRWTARKTQKRKNGYTPIKHMAHVNSK